MNSNYEKQLEARIDRELKRLPDLEAPARLSSKVMLLLERRATMPWYRQSLPHWPVGLQAACVALCLAIVAGFCFGLWKLPETHEYTLLTQQAAGWLSSLEVLWNALTVLGNALSLAAKQMGTTFLIAVVAVGALAWTACLGLGTMAVRLALARR